MRGIILVGRIVSANLLPAGGTLALDLQPTRHSFDRGILAADLGATPTTPAVSAPSDRRQLDRALVKGVAWTGAFRWGTQVISWTVTIALARILRPADYGLYTIATMYVGFVQLVNELGLGAAIVRKRDLTEEQIAAIGGVSIALGGVLWILSLALAPLVAWFFHSSEARWLIIALSLVFVTTALKVLPKSLLARDLQFKRVAAIDAVEALTAAVITLGFAIAGYRYWSLVLGMLSGALASTVVALVWRRHRLAWPASWSVIAPAVNFGSHIMISRICWWTYSNADNAIVGNRLSKALLGAYSYGWTIASIPVDRISGLVAQVTPAIFSAVQNDPPALRRYLVRISEGLALLTFPLSVGLAVVADQFVVTVLGPNWWPAIGPLALLGCYAGIRSVTTPYPHVLQAVGESGRAMRYNLFGVAVLLPLFLLGSLWGVSGVAFAWVIGYPIVTVPMLRAVLRVCQLSFVDYLDAVRPPLIATLVMAAVVLASRYLMPEGWPMALQLAVSVAAGALTYGGIMFTLYRRRLDALRTLANELRR